MSRIALSGGYTPIPEGLHVFKIVRTDYNETYGKLEIVMETKEGKTHTERYTFLKGNGQPNEGAIKAFSYFARTALRDPSVDDIDPADLVGKYIACEVKHDVQPHRDDPNKTVTWIRLGDKHQASSFEGEEPAPATPSGKSFDLDDLLG